MSKPYDAVTKRLIELRPADWIDFLRLPAGEVSLVDADLSTITSYADRLIRVDASEMAYLVHNELESGKDTAMVPLRLFHYNASAVYKTQLPVVSTVFLLHKESNSPRLTGTLDVAGPDRNTYFAFRYNVVRVWQLDVDELLAGGIATLPFAPIANVRSTDIPRVVRVMQTRFARESASKAEEADLWMATNVLMGLRYNTAFKAQMLRGVRQMRESITYKEILDEGRLEEAQRMVLRAGVRRLGLSSPEVEAKITSINSLPLLETLLDRIFDVKTWDELIMPSPSFGDASHTLAQKKIRNPRGRAS